jgi:hypothetical protein
MKREEQDILQNTQLKNSPFSVPEDYFTSLNKSLSEIPKRSKETHARKWVTYTAIAATFALLVAGAGVLLKWDSSDQINTYAEAQKLTEEEIIEYLIYTGVDLEDFEDLELY